LTPWRWRSAYTPPPPWAPATATYRRGICSGASHPVVITMSYTQPGVHNRQLLLPTGRHGGGGVLTLALLHGSIIGCDTEEAPAAAFITVQVIVFLSLIANCYKQETKLYISLLVTISTGMSTCWLTCCGTPAYHTMHYATGVLTCC
jgi:hypothetical protein